MSLLKQFPELFKTFVGTSAPPGFNLLVILVHLDLQFTTSLQRVEFTQALQNDCVYNVVWAFCILV